ncbi:MAG: hypothetical protein P8Z37_04870 [Acidobacteriota bacterium]
MRQSIRYKLFILAILTVTVFHAYPQSVHRYKVLQPLPNSESTSILTENTLFTVYGRAFGHAPVLGRLGQYKSFEEIKPEVDTWLENIKAKKANISNRRPTEDGWSFSIPR